MEEKVWPNITAVDENDTVIGYFQLFDALTKGFIRRISVVFALDIHGNVLVQRRGPNVLAPNLLDFSAAGHVNEGDDYASTAQSELAEELGVKDVDLIPLEEGFSTPGYFNSAYKVILPEETEVIPNPEEVAEVFWLPFGELEQRIINTPEEFTGPFLDIWPRVCDKIRP